MADRGHYRSKGQTRQGIYVCSPSGKLLSSINSLDPDKVLESIRGGLKKWESLTPVERTLVSGEEIEPNHRWEDNYPVGGLVLTSVNTDLPSDPPRTEERTGLWNLDHVWFSKTEARRWLSADPQEGETYPLPEDLANRLFRFHLVDNVRGQTLPFAPQEIKDSKISIQIEERQKSIVRMSITGTSRAVAHGEWLLGKNDWTPNYPLNHGMTSKILGTATYDLNSDSFTKFEMVAIGERFGKTENNSRRSAPDSSHVGFLFTLSGGGPSERIAPAFVDIYGADWIVSPVSETP